LNPHPVPYAQVLDSAHCLMQQLRGCNHGGARDGGAVPYTLNPER